MDCSKRITRKIIKTEIDVIDMSQCCKTILDWIEHKKTKYITAADTHVIVRSWLDLEYRKIINSSDLTTPDGAPLAFGLRLFGYKYQKRVSGPDLMENLIPLLEKRKFKIFFYGSTNKVLSKITKRIKRDYPSLKVYNISPPFRKLNKTEEEDIVKNINRINPDLIFVGLGSPKQDFWINKNKSKINSIFIAVGMAFNIYSKTIPRAPIFMRKNGLEWLFRIYKEPKRLFFRYFISILFFIVGFTIQYSTYFFSNFKKNRFRNLI